MQHFDVVVIGAGLSGLTAAEILARAGRRVAVVEARERVGGRSLTVHSASGMSVDLGGQWIGPTQHRVQGLVERLGLKTYPQYSQGYKRQHIAGAQRRYQGTIPALPAFALMELQCRIWQLDASARRCPPDAAWQHPDAESLDSLSLADWMDRIWSEQTRRLLRLAAHAVFAMEPERISMLQFLAYVQSAGGLMDLLEVEGGAQQTRIAGGTQQLSEGLAARFRECGGELLLGEPVTVLDQDAERALVVTPDRELEADRVIVAMAPADQTRIDMATAVSAARRQIGHEMPMGSVIKCVVIYDKPFWRDQGDSGEYVGEAEPLRMSFDASPPDRHCGALVGFILGRAVQRWNRKSQAERQQAVCQQLASLFGEPAAEPLEYLDQDWSSEEWTGGCYVGLFGPGRMRPHAPLLREAEGRVHWAGTETAGRWNGYFDGAIEAGERAALEVLSA